MLCNDIKINVFLFVSTSFCLISTPNEVPMKHIIINNTLKKQKNTVNSDCIILKKRIRKEGTEEKKRVKSKIWKV